MIRICTKIKNYILKLNFSAHAINYPKFRTKLTLKMRKQKELG